VPADSALTSPVELFTVATVVLLLLQLPPLVVLDSVVLLPAQADNVPVMDSGNALTSTVFTVRHPALNV